MHIGSYDIADQMLGDSDKRVLPGKDTYLIEINHPFNGSPDADPGIAVEYSGTRVVTYLPDGEVIYYHGGWMTLTTQSRMNSWGLPGVTVSKRGTSFFITLPGEPPVEWEGFGVMVKPTKSGDLVIEQLPALSI